MKLFLFLAGVAPAFQFNLPFECPAGTKFNFDNSSSTIVTQAYCCETFTSCKQPSPDSEQAFVCNGNLVRNFDAGPWASAQKVVANQATCCKERTCDEYSNYNYDIDGDDGWEQSAVGFPCPAGTVLSTDYSILRSSNTSQATCCIPVTCGHVQTTKYVEYRSAIPHPCPARMELNSSAISLAPSDTNCCKPATPTCVNAPGAPAAELWIGGELITTAYPFVCSTDTMITNELSLYTMITNELSQNLSPNQTQCCGAVTCRSWLSRSMDVFVDGEYQDGKYQCPAGLLYNSNNDAAEATEANCCTKPTCENAERAFDWEYSGDYRYKKYFSREYACPAGMEYNWNDDNIASLDASTANCCLPFNASCTQINEAHHVYKCPEGTIFIDSEKAPSDANCCTAAKTCQAVRQATCADMPSGWCDISGMVADPAAANIAVKHQEYTVCCKAKPEEHNFSGSFVTQPSLLSSLVQAMAMALALADR